MADLTRREALKLATAALTPISANASPSWASVPSTARYEVNEITLSGPSTGNPFLDVTVAATFSLGHRRVQVDGFYDGEGNYKIRFMPDNEGPWTYTTQSNIPALANQTGAFFCTPPRPGVHGPVSVRNTYHFAYADGTAFFPFGTTCYAWIHQSEALQQQTLRTLAGSPFTKIRMCVFPKHYEYNHNEPALYPFAGTLGHFDFTRPNPAFFAHLERRLADLRALNIEADLILFHPYDDPAKWGFASMPAASDDLYLKYLLARLSCYRNIWWSLANEFDLMRAKTTQDFDRFFHLVEQHDPVPHLRSVHYSKTMYDYGHPWVTHASLQTIDFDRAPEFRKAWQKPICFDEIQYEGNLNKRWGNISGDEMTRRFWLCVIQGCYATHGETFLPPDAALDEATTPTLWWSHGGELHGASPARIALLRKLVEATAAAAGPNSGLTPPPDPYYLNAISTDASGRRPQQILYFFDFHQPLWYEFPLPTGNWTAEFVDTLQATVSPLRGTHAGQPRLRLPAEPYAALRFTRTA
jgi:hypothetical protein